ncbi:MAG: threonine synthase [Treponema sp.]|jgi:threonine synthase|nr:threonine synthase [Treponema sp.]
MQFRSTRSGKPLASFKDAALHCLPPHGGLYVPARVMDIRQFFLYMDSGTTYPELVAAVAPALLQGELNPFSASRVAESAFHFEPELIRLDDRLSILNLYNGPTGTFKDFGIAFLAAVMEELLKNSGQAMILSAARGDSGVSVARAFSGRKGIYSVMVYPSGPVWGLDPSAFAPQGGNVIPIQIRGTFDDCQRLVNETINDRRFAERYGVTSANAINPGRLLPQTFYYLYAFIQIKKQLKGELIFSVPSGNFGNLIAGLYAWKFGMPVNGFIAAMNANNAFGDFIRGNQFAPRPLITTNSPALDVSVPANYERLLSFYEEAPAVMRNMVYPASINDELTLNTMEKVWKQYRVLIDPHTAVAFAAAESLSASREWNGQAHTVVLATGHPAKESALVLKATGQDIKIPEALAETRKKTDPIAVIDPQLEALEGAIASCIR